MKKKKNRRDSVKNPALVPQLNLKTRYELIDYDYINKLSEEEKEWLNAFTEEYVNANMNHDGKKIHNTKKLKRDCYNRNNSRNRCIWTKAKASGSGVNLESIDNSEKKKLSANSENELLEKLDNFQNRKNKSSKKS